MATTSNRRMRTVLWAVAWALAFIGSAFLFKGNPAKDWIQSVLFVAGVTLWLWQPNSASSRSNQREYPVASSLSARRFLAAAGLDRISLLVHPCGSVHHTHRSLPSKMQSPESSGGDQECGHGDVPRQRKQAQQFPVLQGRNESEGRGAAAHPRPTVNGDKSF